MYILVDKWSFLLVTIRRQLPPQSGGVLLHYRRVSLGG